MQQLDDNKTNPSAIGCTPHTTATIGQEIVVQRNIDFHLQFLNKIPILQQLNVEWSP